MKRWSKMMIIGLELLVVLAFLGLGAGMWRYGGLSGFTRRIRAAAADLQPKPAAAPTIRPLATVDPAVIDRLLVVASATAPPATPLPTLYPTPTRFEPSAGATRPASPTAEPPTAVPSLAARPVEPAILLEGYTHHWQDWNNCAPATMATYLSFWSLVRTQEMVAARLKPNKDDKNVNPVEVAALAREWGLESRVDVYSSVEELKLLLNSGLPVMIETWLEPDPNDGMGHYRLVIGYDDRAEEWIVSDSYVSEGVESPYSGIRIAYSQFEASWSVFNRQMVLIYPAGQAELVEEILGAADSDRMWTEALAGLRLELDTAPENPILWHSLGRTLLALGEAEQAAAAFDQARALGLPWRMFWYQFEIFEAYAAAGRYESLLSLAEATIDSGGGGEELYYWKGVGHEKLGETDEAAAAYRYALWWRPAYEPALSGLNQLNS